MKQISIKILFLFTLEKYQFITHKYPQSNHKQLHFPLFYSIVNEIYDPKTTRRHYQKYI